MSIISKTMHAALAAALLAGLTQTADAKTYRMYSQWTENTEGAKVDKWWAAEIKKRTNGAVDIKIFWEGVLGKAKESKARSISPPCHRVIFRLNCLSTQHQTLSPWPCQNQPRRRR